MQIIASNLLKDHVQDTSIVDNALLYMMSFWCIKMITDLFLLISLWQNLECDNFTANSSSLVPKELQPVSSKKNHLIIKGNDKMRTPSPWTSYLRGPGPWTTLVDHGPLLWTTLVDHLRNFAYRTID